MVLGLGLGLGLGMPTAGSLEGVKVGRSHMVVLLYKSPMVGSLGGVRRVGHSGVGTDGVEGRGNPTPNPNPNPNQLPAAIALTRTV